MKADWMRSLNSIGDKLPARLARDDLVVLQVQGIAVSHSPMLLQAPKLQRRYVLCT